MSTASIERVTSGAPWEARVGYCRALRAGDHIHVTGTVALNDDRTPTAPGDAGAQTTRCFEIIERALRQLGASRRHIVRTRLYVTDITRFEEVGAAHKAFVGDAHPCTTLVEVSALVSPEHVVEIEVDAYAPQIPSHLRGDPALHLDLAALAQGYEALPAPPTSHGRVVHLVRRRANHDREMPHSAWFTPEDGLVGDRWATGSRKPDTQVTAMRADVGALVANHQSPGLFDDQLHLDLDLSAVNLPVGSRLRLGPVPFVVTPEPHSGCALYRQRFGADALRFISAPQRRDLRLRGVYLRPLEPGRVTVDDPVVVETRGA